MVDVLDILVCILTVVGGAVSSDELLDHDYQEYLKG